MKKFFRNKKVLTIFVVIIAILSVLSITVRMRNRRDTPLFIQKMGNDTVTVITQIVNWPLNLVTGGASNVQSLLNTQEENDHLKKQIDDLGQTKARNNSLEAENDQLKSALN